MTRENWFTPDQDRLVLELRASGVAFGTIAAQFGRSYDSVKSRVHKIIAAQHKRDGVLIGKRAGRQSGPAIGSHRGSLEQRDADIKATDKLLNRLNKYHRRPSPMAPSMRLPIFMPARGHPELPIGRTNCTF